MAKKLSKWCKAAKIAMINADMSVPELAEALDLNRTYLSTILNGRVYSAPAVKRISDYLNIEDSAGTTVSE